MSRQHLDKRKLRRLRRARGKRGQAEAQIEAPEPVAEDVRELTESKGNDTRQATSGEWDLRAAVISDPPTDELV